MCEKVLLFKDGRFHMEEVSFCIPDGYYLNTDPDEPLGDVSIELVAADKTHRVSMHVSYDELPSGEQLIDMIKDMGSKMLSKPEPITINGLHGRIAAYKTSRRIYAEAIFDLDNWEEYNAFHLVFIFPGDYDIAGFTASEAFLRLAQDIRKE